MPLSACPYDNPLPSYSQKTPFFAKNAYFPVAKVDEFFLAIHIWQTYKSPDFKVSSPLFVEVINF